MAMADKKGELNAEINVTPLVDVMLVLLIIFMVTAPMLNTGVDLTLPRAEAQVLPDDSIRVILSIDKKGELYLGSAAIPWVELETRLRGQVKLQSDGELYIEADESLPYGAVLKTMAIAKKAGVIKLFLLTDPLQVASTTESVPRR